MTSRSVDDQILPGGGSPAPARLRQRRRTVLVSLLVAFALVAGAWAIGERQGFDQIGQGGVNTSLLPKIGEPAPNFFALLSDGRLIQLSDLEGQPVWLNFWGSWCPPCRAEMPEMQAAYEQLRPQGLELLAVSLDEPAEVAFNYAELNGVTYLVATDPDRIATGEVYPIVNFPTHILIDRAGIIRDIVLAPLSTEEFLEHARTILPPKEAQ